MSTLLDALRNRIDGDLRSTIRVKIYLDPDAHSRLTELETRATEIRAQIDAGTRREKMNGPLSQILTQIQETETALLTSTAHVVLRCLTSDQLAAALASVSPNDPMSMLWRQKVAAAFVRVEDLDGKPVDDITADDWRDLLNVLGANELQNIHQRLSDAEASVTDPR